MAKGFVGAMKEYFGMKPGQAISEFAAELKALSYEEKMQFWEMLNPIIPCDKPMETKAA